MPPIEITYRLTNLTKSTGIATAVVESFYVPRVGEQVRLKTALIDGKWFEYIGIVCHVSYLQLPDRQSVNIVLD